MLSMLMLEAVVVILASVFFWDAVRQTNGRESLASRVSRQRSTLADEAEQWLKDG